MKRTAPIFKTLLLALIASQLLQAQTDPFLGTWKLNARKSKFEARTGLKTETRVVVTGPTGMNVSVKRVNADNRTQEFEYTTNLDGKPYPIVGEGPDGADSVAADLTAPNVIQVSMLREGKVIDRATVTVSQDGRSMTITSKGVRAVYDKQ